VKITNKKMTIIITLLLTITLAVPLIELPTANAAVTNYASHIYCYAAPNVVGVGQAMEIVYFVDNVPPDIGEADHLVASPSGRAGWGGITMTITAPDGTNDTESLPWSDPVGSGFLMYTPSQAGAYYIQAFFPATWKNTTTTQAFYGTAVSNYAAFTVQQEPISQWVESPVTNDYWTRPISGLSRNWYALEGDWMGGAANVYPLGGAGGTTTTYAYGEAPETSHILWTKPLWEGGLMDKRLGAETFTPSHYSGITFVPIILNGRIYYSPPYTGLARSGLEVVDLYSGQTMYLNYSDIMPAFASIYNYVSPNQKGGYTYLWLTSGVTLPSLVRLGRSTTQVNSSTVTTGTLWEMLDAQTMGVVCYIANVSSSGTAVYGIDGSILRYALGATSTATPYLTVWNASAIPSMLAGDTSTNYWMWRPSGGGMSTGLATNVVHDGSNGYSLNVTIPSVLGPRNSLLNQTASIQVVRQDQYLIVGTAGRNDERGVVPGWLMSISLEPGHAGTKLWETTFTPPYASTAANETISLTGVYPEDGVILFWNAKTLTRWGYDMTSGQLLWTSEPEPASNYQMYTVVDVYEGKLITTGCSGVVLAYDMRTGEIVWNYSAGFDFLSESPYGNSPLCISCIADGKMYFGVTFWGTNPEWRDYIRCVNMSNGVELWKLLCIDRTGGIAGQVYEADGRIVCLNYADNSIYCIGKGPSGTTVSAPQTVPPLGSSVMITGTVTDQTPSGRRNENDLVDWTLKGTPAISDDSMEAWMEYLYEQQAKPTNATGVSVSLDVNDPNGNVFHIGDATTDMNGNYGFKYTPTVPGNYQIIATFAGSKAYGPSSSTTYLSIGEATPTASAYPQIELPPTEMYIVGGVIAIIIAIAIVGFVLALMIRKRP
jgi:hypothetical protein